MTDLVLGEALRPGGNIVIVSATLFFENLAMLFLLLLYGWYYRFYINLFV